MLYGQALIASAVGVSLLLAGIRVSTGPEAWTALLVSDATLLLATFCLYRAVAIGRLSVAAGDRLSRVSAAGLALVAAGAALSATSARAGGAQGAAAGQAEGAGVALAAGAAVLYGFGFWLQGRHAVPETGAFFALWSYYALGFVSLLAATLLSGHRLHPPSGRKAAFVFGTALCAFRGYLALVLGQASGEVAVVTVLSASASGVTVLLSRVFLGERTADGRARPCRGRGGARPSSPQLTRPLWQGGRRTPILNRSR